MYFLINENVYECISMSKIKYLKKEPEEEKNKRKFNAMKVEGKKMCSMNPIKMFFL